MANDGDDLKRARAVVRALEARLEQQLPLPDNTETGDRFDRRMRDTARSHDGREVHAFPPHLRTWFDTLSEADVARLEKLIALRAETNTWISEKNDRELRSLDGAVEFINSSRTAARVLMWVCGAAVTFVGGCVALAKSGYDIFSMLRSGR